MKSKLVLMRVFLSIVLVVVAHTINAQEKHDTLNKALYKEIAHMDSVLFNAFNTRDTAYFKSLFTEDLEFYHDKGGLTGYQHTIAFMTEVSKPGNDLRRDLVKGSLEIYPIPGYGAMEIGSHAFCHTENGKQGCGTFKFVHIWKKTNDKWKISRVVSYGH